MEPSVVAVIADSTSGLCPGLLEACDAIDKAKARFLVANSAEDFLAGYGADLLAKVSVIVLGVFAGGAPGVIADIWPRCPDVRWVHSLAAGVDTLVPVLRTLPRIEDVPITNAKGAFSRSLAEYSMAAMLHFNKQVPLLQANKEAGRWSKFTMSELHGSTVGFVGFGDIAQTTAGVCRALGMRVLALRRHVGAAGGKAAADVTFGADERLEVFKRSDFVICSMPGTPETHHFCGAEEFGAMKPSAVFISIGRGMCVDEAALCEALTSGSIAGAALDVFETEPLPPASPLWAAPNLLLSPHNADLTGTYIRDSYDVFAEKLDRFRSSPETFGGTVSLELGY